MKTIAPNLYIRGKHGNIYVRRRIPKALKEAYPPEKTHETVCLHTSDVRVAKVLQRQEELRTDIEFKRRLEEFKKKQADRAAKRLDKMSDEQLTSLADYWVRQVLLTDELHRGDASEEEFDQLGQQMQESRAELGRMMAMGRPDKILPAMHTFIHLCGLEVSMSPEEAKRAGAVFLKAICAALDFQMQRQRGEVVDTEKVAPASPTPKEVATAKTDADAKIVGWDDAFAIWRDYVPGRPKSTTIATQTPFLELKRLAAEDCIENPNAVTPELMRKFVDHMSARGLMVVTLNERLAKLKSLFKVLLGKGRGK